MPMGIVSDSDYELELERLGIVPRSRSPESDQIQRGEASPDEPVANVEDQKQGRGDSKNVPDIVREMVAKSAINGEGTGADIAEAFGVSPASVSAYKVGATSCATYNEPSDDLLTTVLGHRKNIAKGARVTLEAALASLTPDKLQEAKARDLSAIAKDMSGIIVDMEPAPPPIMNQQNVQFVFMAPRVRSEDSYEIRDVND